MHVDVRSFGGVIYLFPYPGACATPTFDLPRAPRGLISPANPQRFTQSRTTPPRPSNYRCGLCGGLREGYFGGTRIVATRRNESKILHACMQCADLGCAIRHAGTTETGHKQLPDKRGKSRAIWLVWAWGDRVTVEEWRTWRMEERELPRERKTSDELNGMASLVPK